MTKVIVVLKNKRIVLTFNSFHEAIDEGAYLTSIGYYVIVR